jgi:hypothetical protein
LTFYFKLCTLTGPYTNMHTHSVTPTHTLTPFSHSHICTYISTDCTPTHMEAAATFSYILLPSHLTPICIYLHHSNFPAHVNIMDTN